VVRALPPMAAAMEPAPGSLECQLATALAQADADGLNAEHLMEQMEQRYVSLAAEHSQVRAMGRDTESSARTHTHTHTHVEGDREKASASTPLVCADWGRASLGGDE